MLSRKFLIYNLRPAHQTRPWSRETRIVCLLASVVGVLGDGRGVRSAQASRLDDAYVGIVKVREYGPRFKNNDNNKSGFFIVWYSHSMCQYSRLVCKEIITFDHMKKKKLVVIFFMLWKEVVEHICDRGSPLKHLPNRSCSQAGFPPPRCFLWPGCGLKSAARPVVSDRYLQVRAVDEVTVSLSLTKKQGRKFDCGSLNRE